MLTIVCCCSKCVCARVSISPRSLLCPFTFTRAESSMGGFAHLLCLFSFHYKLICIFERGESMLYRLAMCSYFRYRPPRFVDSCRSPVESAHRPRSKISYLDCLSRVQQAQQSPSHAIPHSRRGSLIPSQTHDARVKYHDGEPDELDRIMHESRKEFLVESIHVLFIVFKARHSTKERRNHNPIFIVDVKLSMETNSLISSSPEPVPEPPCRGANLLTLMQAKAVARQIKLLFDSLSDLVARR